jgi:RimJ/RimL family protein N-acetyltransferase
MEGARVRLRAPTAADLPRIFAWYEDPELSAPFDRFSVDSFDGLAQSIRDAAEDPTSLAPRFVVEPVAGGGIVGCVGHYRAHPVLTLLDVWYLIGEPTARGGGFGSEAVRLLVNHLFDSTAVARVGATCDVENAGSYRLLDRLGFRREGELRSALFHHARWHDVAIYGVTRPEWSVRRSAPG